MKIGIIGAMAQEVEILRNKMSRVNSRQVGGCTIYQGYLSDTEVSDRKSVV